MLGRRAALIGSVVVLAVGGGTALAAAQHGSSPQQKPAPAQKAPLVKQEKLQLQKTGQHKKHCKHESNVSPADV